MTFHVSDRDQSPIIKFLVRQGTDLIGRGGSSERCGNTRPITESFNSFVNSFNVIMARVFQAPDGPDERGDEGFGGSLRRRGLVDSNICLTFVFS